MEHVEIEERMTHRYVGKHASEDEWRFVGEIELTPPRLARTPDPEDWHWDSGTYVRFARLPAGLTKRQRAQWLQAIGDTLSVVGCACEHDCCGCTSVRTRAIPLNRRDVLVQSRQTRNY